MIKHNLKSQRRQQFRNRGSISQGFYNFRFNHHTIIEDIEKSQTNQVLYESDKIFPFCQMVSL
jgi:hypothetical protein